MASNWDYRKYYWKKVYKSLRDAYIYLKLALFFKQEKK